MNWSDLTQTFRYQTAQGAQVSTINTLTVLILSSEVCAAVHKGLEATNKNSGRKKSGVSPRFPPA